MSVSVGKAPRVSLVAVRTLCSWAGLGVSFLLYLSFRLFTDSGLASGQAGSKAPNFITGAVMQWLNPKAWLAVVASIVAYIPQTNTEHVFIFAAVYLPVCWLSLAVWLWAGIALGRRVQSESAMRLLNKTLAVLLAFSCVLLVL